MNANAYSGLLFILFKAYHEAIICFKTDLKKQHSSHVASYLMTYIEHLSQFIRFVLTRGYELLTVVKEHETWFYENPNYTTYFEV